MYWLQAITPLHVGAGKGVGFIDLPIMREKVTNWPLVPGSAVKGVVRDHFTQNGSDEQKKLIDIAFGRQANDDLSNAGSLVLTDAHIVCLPVRSLYGTFAYTTSHLVLERLTRDLEAAGYNNLPQPPSPMNEEAFHT
jgi:CRISPR-associated protein Cmr4